MLGRQVVHCDAVRVSILLTAWFESRGAALFQASAVTGRLGRKPFRVRADINHRDSAAGLKPCDQFEEERGCGLSL